MSVCIVGKIFFLLSFSMCTIFIVYYKTIKFSLSHFWKSMPRLMRLAHGILLVAIRSRSDHFSCCITEPMRSDWVKPVQEASFKIVCKVLHSFHKTNTLSLNLVLVLYYIKMIYLHQVAFSVYDRS